MPHITRTLCVLTLFALAGCKSEATVTMSLPPAIPEPPPAPPPTKPTTGAAALKTHGQLRETFEALTGVVMPASAYVPLVPHLPHQQALQGLTGASQAAIFRLASEHCAYVVSDENATLAGKLFGVTPSDKPFDAQQIELLASKSMALWPQASAAAAAEFKLMLEEVLEAAEPPKPTQRAMVLSACTATLASAHVSMH